MENRRRRVWPKNYLARFKIHHGEASVSIKANKQTSKCQSPCLSDDFDSNFAILIIPACTSKTTQGVMILLLLLVLGIEVIYNIAEASSAAVVWEGRYSYFRADETLLVFSNGTEYKVKSDSSRSFPSWCDDGCFQAGNVLLPLSMNPYRLQLSFESHIGLLIDSVGSEMDVPGGFPSEPQAWYTLANITLSSDPTNSHSDPQSESYSWMYQGQSIYVTQDYDGLFCEEVQFDFRHPSEVEEEGLLFKGTNVAMGAFQKEGYCPKNLFHPCGEGERCVLENNQLSCVPNTISPSLRTTPGILDCIPVDYKDHHDDFFDLKEDDKSESINPSSRSRLVAVLLVFVCFFV